MNRLLPFAAILALTGVVACDREEEVVQQPAPNMAPVPVEGERADAALQNTAQYFGMTREQLEDADLLSRDNTDLGDVETLIADPQGRLTHVVVELEGPGDPKVQVPVGDLEAVDNNGEKDLITDLTAAQLQALPTWAMGNAAQTAPTTPQAPAPAQ